MSIGKVFVGNLPWQITEDEVKEHFSQVGEVKDVKIIKDRETNKSKGFGFVEMNNSQDAIDKLNGVLLGERALVVSEARQKEKSSYPQR